MLWKGDSTEKTNFAHLWAIADILGRGTRLDDIDTHAVDKVIKGLAKLGKADGTINRYLSHLRTFLVWAKKRKYRSAPVEGEDGEIGRAHVCTPVTNAHLVCRLLLAKKKNTQHII